MTPGGQPLSHYDRTFDLKFLRRGDDARSKKSVMLVTKNRGLVQGVLEVSV